MRAAAVMLAAAVAACGGDAGADGNAAGGLERMTLERTLEIGSVEGPDALGEVISVASGPGGELFVAQFRDPTVSVFGADGTVLPRIGRRGQGPAEFAAPGPLGFRGDSLWVADALNNRIVLFDPDGSVIRESRFIVTVPGLPCSFRGGRYLSDATLVVEATCGVDDLLSGDFSLLPVLKVSEDGRVLDTLALIPPTRRAAGIRFGDEGGIYMQIPELAPPDRAHSPDGDVLVRVFTEPADGDRGHRLIALWIDPAGDTVGRAEADYTRRPFAEETKEKILARFLGQFDPGEGPSGITPDAFRAAFMERVPWPAENPPAAEAVLDPQDRLWLRRDEAGDSVRWEVWSPNTGPTAEAWLPAGLVVKYVGDDHLWGVREDDMDVPYLVRYSFEVIR